MPAKRTIPRACERCGNSFLVAQKEINRGGGRFCGHRCANAYHRASQVFTLTCEICAKTFTVTKPSDAARRRFCSYPCMGKGRTRDMNVPIAERFWPKVNKNGPIPPHLPKLGPCWPWLASLYQNGYGQFFRRHGHPTHAHIVAYELMIGSVPDGLVLDHLCHNGSGCQEDDLCPHRRCVNPAHLEPVTHRTNLLRGETITARNTAKTHCPARHPYDAENTGRNKDNSRYCRECRRFRQSGYPVRQRAYSPNLCK